MIGIKNICRLIVAQALNQFKQTKNPDLDDIKPEFLAAETPPNPQMGEAGFPMFVFAKTFKMSPAAIASEVVKIINSSSAASDGSLFGKSNLSGEFFAVGPYVNVKINKSAATLNLLSAIESEGSDFGSLNASGSRFCEDQRVMIEFSSPNTNKPLHLGHMRNDALGESVSRILQKAGAKVFKVNIINNRGVHICKSMLAYRLFHEQKNETPASLKMKGDRFAGQCYVEFDKYAKEHPEAQQQAEQMLVDWEKGDEATLSLWRQMNEWTLSGIKQTYERTGVSFDKLYFESETYLKGKDEILKGLERGIFFRAGDGSVRIDVTEAVGKGKNGEDHEKVLLRKDGTSVYITQDIGTAISRHNDWQFNRMIYVVASEQIFHFKVLFYILKKLGFDWADRLHHLSYGLVNLPSGRMKSREGTIVDADDLIDSLHADALLAIKERGRQEELADSDVAAEKIALAALHYYLLQVSPVKDMIFNPEESLSFNGNTGPYIQYMGARIASILRKAGAAGVSPSSPQEAAPLLSTPEEWDLVKKLSEYPEIIEKSAADLDPSITACYLYDIAKSFAKFYQNCPILSAQNDALKSARLLLAKAALFVLKDAMNLVLVPYLDEM